MSLLFILVVLAALGGSTNAAIHVIALARRAGIALTLADLDKLELVMTKVGTATTLNNFHAHVEVE